MAPNKSKRGAEDSPEERRSKRKKPNDEDEEEEKEREPISKGKSSSSKKTPAFSGGSSHKPAELFRKDLISAMKLADSEPLSSEDYLLIADSWRQEWERGVQVPVNEISLKSVELREVCEKNKSPGDFKIPKKHLHESKDDTYQLGAHELTGMQQLSEQIVRYDLDDLDVSWLRQLNEQREEVGEELIHEWTMERVIEALENQCHENMEIRKKTEEGLGIEYDEDIVCEICHSPDSEDSNEMVFCDGCDICVHQACYGIQTVPEGSWLCRTCALGIKPACILCPKAGGAMKSTRSGTKWAHVSCAIWIPEVTIGCVDKMEPITKISQIPASRWSLICVICKERSGACIQCSVKACKTAFHVTCAFAEKLEMKTVLIEDKNNEDVKLKAYCPKHSKKRDRNNSESESDSPRKSNSGTPIKDRIHEMSEEEKATLRAERLRKLEEEFYLLIKISDIGKQLDLREEIIHLIFIFWKLKRKSLYNRPLLTPKTEEADLLEKQQEDSLVARMKMFVHLRQDLERVRNLSYMISKREKIKRQFNRSRESVFYATLEVLTDKKLTLTAKEVDKIVNQYRDLPAPYSKDANYGKEVKKGKSLSSLVKSESRKSIEKDSDTLSVCSTHSIKSKIGPSGRGIKNIINKQKVKQSVSETPKSRRSRHKSDQADVKLNLKTEMATDVKNVDIEENDMAQNDVNNSAMETSVFPDVGKEDETIVNTSQTSSTDTITLTHSESESLKSPPPSQKGKKLSRNRNSVGKLEKNSKNLGDKQIERTTENIDIDLEKVENAKRGRKSRSQSTQRDSASVETINKSEINILDDTIPVPEEIMTLSEKPTQRERRQSAAVKLSEDEKTELVTEFPSAKNVSDHIKAELNGYLKNNKLIVSNKLRRKVQNSLLSGKRRNRLSNGIIIDHSQKKIDSFLIKSPPQCDSSYKSPVKNVSRVLNELSPTRDRFEANNIERTASLKGSIKMSDFQIQRKSGNTPTRCSPLSHVTDRSKSVEGESVTDESAEFRNSNKKYDGSVISVREKLFDSEKKRLTRASRESTPDSCTSSVKSFSSYKRDRRRSDVEHVRTRSNTPVLGGKDYDDNETDLENFCEETKRRRTRSQHVDEMIACDGSASPSGLRRSHIENVGS